MDSDNLGMHGITQVGSAGSSSSALFVELVLGASNILFVSLGLKPLERKIRSRVFNSFSMYSSEHIVCARWTIVLVRPLKMLGWWQDLRLRYKFVWVGLRYVINTIWASDFLIITSKKRIVEFSSISIVFSFELRAWSNWWIGGILQYHRQKWSNVRECHPHSEATYLGNISGMRVLFLLPILRRRTYKYSPRYNSNSSP